MDFNKLIPDFGAFGRTDWAKPSIKTGDKNWIISIAIVALMLIFLFLPWTSATQSGVTVSRLGITTWYGIIGLISVAIAAYGVLYEQKQSWALSVCFASLSSLQPLTVKRLRLLLRLLRI